MNSIKLSQLLAIFVLSGIQTIVCQGNKFKVPIKSPSQLTPSNPNIQPISHQTSQQTSSHPAKPGDDDYDDDIPDAANANKIGQARPNVQANHPNTAPLSANNKAKLDLIRKSSPKTPVPPRSVSNSNLEHEDEDRVTPSPTLYGLLKSVPPPTRPVRPLKQFKSLPLKAITLHPNGNDNTPNQLISRANNAKPVVTLTKNNIEVLTTTIDPEHCNDTDTHTEETITMKPIAIKSDNLPHSPVHDSVVGSHPIPTSKPNDHSNGDHNNDLDDILDYGEDVPHEVANHTNDLATSLPDKANQELTNGTEVITPSIPVAQKIPPVQRSPDGVVAMPHSQNDPDSINDAVSKAPQRGVTTEPPDQISTDEESGPPPAQVNVVQPSHSSTTENLNRLLQNPGSPTDLESDGGHPRNGSANNGTGTEIPSASLGDSLPEEGVAAIGDHIDVPLDKVRKHLLDKLSQLSDHEDLNDETSAMAHRLKDIFNEFAAKQINELTDDDLDGDHIKPIAAVTLSDDSPDVRANQMREALKHIKDNIANKPDQEHHDGPDGPDDDHDIGDHLAKVKHHLEKASQIQSSDNNTGNPKMPMVIPLTIPSRRQNQLPPFLQPPRGIWPPTGPFIFSQALQPRRRGQGLRPPPLLPMLPNPQTTPNFPFFSMKRTQVMAPNRRQFNRPFNPTIMINPQVIHTQQNFGADKWSQPQAFPPNNRRRSLSNSIFQPIMNQIEMTYVPNQMQSSSNPLRRALSSPTNQFSMFRMTPNQNSGQRLNSQSLRQLILNANRH